jgi:tRNA modification GTPase
MTADTIFAVASGTSKSGVAVIRISGPASVTTLSRLSSRDVPVRKAVYTPLRDPVTGDLLDNALVLRFAGPASFTGEDTVELQVHGGRAVVDGVLAALAALPELRPADPGEFTRRAFLNGKLDLAQAEALADLIDAETVMQRKQALRGLDGGIGHLAERWRADLIDARALAEATIDFSDEDDVPDEARDTIKTMLRSLRQEVAAVLDDRHRGERIRDGFSVVIAGPPNAGKSTLLNLLARRDAAIVSAHAGTTRDVIEVHLDLGGYPVVLADTAGLRDSIDPVEMEGIRRTRMRADQADLVLWLSDDGTAPDLAADAPIWCIRSKADTGRRRAALAETPISAVSGEGVSPLLDRLVAEVASRLGGGSSGANITRARHRHALSAALEAIDQALGQDEIELLAEELRVASHELGRVSGHTDPEHVLDAVFSRFCIGK